MRRCPLGASPQHPSMRGPAPYRGPDPLTPEGARIVLRVRFCGASTDSKAPTPTNRGAFPRHRPPSSPHPRRVAVVYGIDGGRDRRAGREGRGFVDDLALDRGRVLLPRAAGDDDHLGAALLVVVEIEPQKGRLELAVAKPRVMRPLVTGHDLPPQ